MLPFGCTDPGGLLTSLRENTRKLYFVLPHAVETQPMQTVDNALGTTPTSPHHEQYRVALAAASACLIWYVSVIIVCLLGFTQLWRHYSQPPVLAKPRLGATHDVTIIRPVKGLEPSLYDCLASAFYQDYPRYRLHIRFCISNRDDLAYPVLERLVRDFPDHDAQILVEADDEARRRAELGPNPKIRNLSHAYREAIGDIVWIVDSNVWLAKGVCARMVAKLNGVGERRKNKFVHQLPLVIDTVGTTTREETHGLPERDDNTLTRTTSTTGQDMLGSDRNYWSIGGGRLEELFISSSHAKFYTAINTILIAPCIVGKSTMFRRSHLDTLTDGQGIDYFSHNICEDHLIGDLLWKHQVPEERQGEKWGKHALCFGDLAIQPMANMSVSEYWSRRVRWLRVRKFTVLLATLVEPGTESFLCSLYGAFAVTTLPFFHAKLGISQTWTAFACLWLLSVGIWCAADWILYEKLHSAASIEVDEHTPAFARPPVGGRRRRFAEWLLAWTVRESLALPIWTWAFYGGMTVEWRGKKFRVGMDTKVHEIKSGLEEGYDRPVFSNGYAKGRRD